MVAKGVGGGSGMDWELRVGRCKLLHLEWMSSEVVLYGTRELYPISWDRVLWKVIWEKECVCVYMYMAGFLCCTAEINTAV